MAQKKIMKSYVISHLALMFKNVKLGPEKHRKANWALPVRTQQTPKLPKEPK